MDGSVLVERDAEARVADERVAIVCMPFASSDRPSIQLGLVGAITRRAGYETDLLHFNLNLASRLGAPLYERLCQSRQHMTGEWLFSIAAFGADAPSTPDDYFAAFPGEADWAAEIGSSTAGLAELRETVLPQFVDDCAAAVDWTRYRVVGFSSLFQQNVASLALARRIKALSPATAIVFGGANMEGEMGAEVARAFPWVDFVVSGEADEVFPKLLDAICRGETPDLPGVYVRDAGEVRGGGHAGPITDLDALPAPDYGPYFAQAEELGLVDDFRRTWTLPIETSRGCWWGQKHHCTFCGLNGLGMGFRSKSPQRVMAELSDLADRHRIVSFVAVDNILDMKYVDALFVQNAQKRLDYSFFYETKANLTRAQIKTMFLGGVRRIQPGIESMSTDVLALMRKGCSMLQNVNTLRWCRYYGIGVNWNLIWGFPGERPEHYANELAALRCLAHLEPPIGEGRIWLERFSPNYVDRKTFPVSNVRAERSYAFVYPAHVDVDRIAYFFDYEMGDTVDQSLHAETHAWVTEWRNAWASARRPSLSYRRVADGMLIDHYLDEERQGSYAISGANAWLYEACVEAPQSPRILAERLNAETPGLDASEDEVRETLDLFCDNRLMLTEKDRYLSLALPLNPNW